MNDSLITRLTTVRAGWLSRTESTKDFNVFLDSESRIMVEEVKNIGQTAV